MNVDGPPTLSSGALSLLLAPANGGSIARFEYDAGAGMQIPVFRGTCDGAAAILDHASFPLVPFCNRIAGGRFSFRGREVALAPNLSGEASPLHGQGWIARWRVDRLAGASAELSFRHAAGEWPWEYEARQRFALDPGGLSLELSCTNLSGEPMPCGLGHHPYFPCTAATRLDTSAEWAWTIDADVLPVARVPARGRYRLEGRAACGQGLDNGFGGWSGRALIDDPAWPFRIALSAPDARFFHLYSPPGGGFFAAEPVGHAPGALNAPEAEWPDLGMRVLEPGGTMSLAMRVEVVPARPPLRGAGSDGEAQ